jgi:hypothetical protein
MYIHRCSRRSIRQRHRKLDAGRCGAGAGAWHDVSRSNNKPITSKGSTEGKPRLSCDCKRERPFPPIPHLSAQLACPGTRRRIRLPQLSPFSVSFLPHLFLLIRFLLMRGTRVCRYRYGNNVDHHPIQFSSSRIESQFPHLSHLPIHTLEKFTQCLPPPLSDTLFPW